MLKALSLAPIAALLAATLSSPAIALPLAPNETQLSDGLTIAARHATASPTVALEAWIICPSNGYDGAKPGIARLTGLSIASTKVAGASLRDLVRLEGGQISVSIFPGSTEIAIVVPAYAADRLADALVSRIFQPTVDAAGFRDAKLRMAEQQLLASGNPALLLRDAVFNTLFANGPFHASPFGTSSSLKTMTAADVRTFAAQAYQPGNAIVVAVGSVDEQAFLRRITSAAPPAGSIPAFPASVQTTPPAQPTMNGFADTAGVALGWVGPAVDDERASTAMDFISDYLTRPSYGLVARALHTSNPAIDFSGQFITLRGAGVFYMSASADKLPVQLTADAMRAAMKPLLDGPLPGAEFARAIDAFRTHTLRDAQTPQQLADNYGWYFAQGAPAYTPSAIDSALSGDYFKRAAALTPDLVFRTAKTYLTGAPAIVTVAPRPTGQTTTGDMPPQRVLTRGGSIR